MATTEQIVHTLERMALRREHSGCVTDKGRRWAAAELEALRAAIAALSHAAGQEVVDCVRSSELWYAIDEAKNPADFLARAIAILQRSNMAMVDNTAVLEPAVARSEGEE